VGDSLRRGSRYEVNHKDLMSTRSDVYLKELKTVRRQKGGRVVARCLISGAFSREKGEKKKGGHLNCRTPDVMYNGLKKTLLQTV